MQAVIDQIWKKSLISARFNDTNRYFSQQTPFKFMQKNHGGKNKVSFKSEEL